MYVSYNRDPEICPLYRGVHYRGVSIKRGFTVLQKSLEGRVVWTTVWTFRILNFFNFFCRFQFKAEVNVHVVLTCVCVCVCVFVSACASSSVSQLSFRQSCDTIWHHHSCHVIFLVVMWHTIALWHCCHVIQCVTLYDIMVMWCKCNYHCCHVMYYIIIAILWHDCLHVFRSCENNSDKNYSHSKNFFVS